MRGVVSLAAALSIPALIQQDQPFPYRNLILFITFIVILVTLVFQGLTLPFVMRKVRIHDEFAEIRAREQELAVRKIIAESSLQYLQTKSNSHDNNEHIKNLSLKLATDLTIFRQGFEEFNNSGKHSLIQYQELYLGLLEAQREALNELNRSQDYDEDLIRKYLSLTDLEETKLREVAM